MANDLNQCQFIGRVGKIDTRFTASGDAITNISLACNESWKKDGQKKEKTEWVSITIFGKLAEIARSYVEKGSQIYISGKWKSRKWQDKQGQDRYSTEVVIDGFNGAMQMIGSNKGAGENRHPQKQEPSQNQPNSRPSQTPQQQEFNNDFDDDLPF